VSHPVAEARPAAQGDALNGLRAAVAEASDPEAAAQRAVELLHDRFAHYDWVGIYWVDGSDLVLGPWVGPEATEHTRIPIGTGVCGAAAASGRTEIVDDVSRDNRYLACFASTKSEIVVPIFDGGDVVGEIDVDGSDLAAFDEMDARFLEEAAALLAPLRPRP
jgi:L-methionine (R)-S-oxide reductase